MSDKPGVTHREHDYHRRNSLSDFGEGWTMTFMAARVLEESR